MYAHCRPLTALFAALNLHGDATLPQYSSWVSVNLEPLNHLAEVLSAFVGPGVRICDGDRIVEKNLLGPPQVLSAFVGPGVRIYDGDRVVEKNCSGPQKFFSIATKSGMTASAYTSSISKLIWVTSLRSL